MPKKVDSNQAEIVADLRLFRIEKLQQARDYADEVESARLTQAIARLQYEHDSMEQGVHPNPGRE